MTSRARLFWILAFLNVIWAASNFMFKVGQREASPAALVLIRWVFLAVLICGAVLLPVTRRYVNCQLPRGADRVKAFLIGLFCVALAYNLNSLCLTRTSTVEANLLSQSSPVVMAVLAYFFLKERVRPRRWLAIGIGVLGAYVVAVGLRPPSLEGAHTPGNLICAGGLLLEVVSLIMATRIVLRSSGLGVLAFEAVGAAIGCALYPLAFPRFFPLAVHGFGPATAGAMLYLVVVAGAFAFGTWYVLVERAPVSLMMISTVLQPPVAAVLGVALLGEVLAPHTLYGSVFIVAALVVTATDRGTSRLPIENVGGDQAGQDGDRDGDHRDRRESRVLGNVPVEEEA